MNKCDMTVRVDDIPKHRKREKTYVCETCGRVMFATRKPPCVREEVEEIDRRIAEHKGQDHASS